MIAYMIVLIVFFSLIVILKSLKYRHESRKLKQLLVDFRYLTSIVRRGLEHNLSKEYVFQNLDLSGFSSELKEVLAKVKNMLKIGIPLKIALTTMMLKCDILRKFMKLVPEVSILFSSDDINEIKCLERILNIHITYTDRIRSIYKVYSLRLKTLLGISCFSYALLTIIVKIASTLLKLTPIISLLNILPSIILLIVFTISYTSLSVVADTQALTYSILFASFYALFYVLFSNVIKVFIPELIIPL